MTAGAAGAGGGAGVGAALLGAAGGAVAASSEAVMPPPWSAAAGAALGAARAWPARGASAAWAGRSAPAPRRARRACDRPRARRRCSAASFGSARRRPLRDLAQIGERVAQRPGGGGRRSAIGAAFELVPPGDRRSIGSAVPQPASSARQRAPARRRRAPAHACAAPRVSLAPGRLHRALSTIRHYPLRAAPLGPASVRGLARPVARNSQPGSTGPEGYPDGRRPQDHASGHRCCPAFGCPTPPLLGRTHGRHRRALPAHRGRLAEAPGAGDAGAPTRSTSAAPSWR